MIGYIIGVILGVIVFLLQNMKPTSFKFRVLYLILTVSFIWSMHYVDAGFWHFLIIPFGETVLCLISAICFPYSSTSARSEYISANGRDYYSELEDSEKIGRIDASGFKQTYDRIISGILSDLATNEYDFQILARKIYSKNFYPISSHTKAEVLSHLNRAIEEVSSSSKYGKKIRDRATNQIGLLFNSYVSAMAIYEEATRRIEKLEKEKEQLVKNHQALEDKSQNY